MKPGTLEEIWEHFARTVGLVQGAVPEVQWRESRRCFYAGMQGMMLALRMASDLPEEDAVRVLEDYHQQFAAFAAGIRSGLA